MGAVIASRAGSPFSPGNQHLSPLSSLRGPEGPPGHRAGSRGLGQGLPRPAGALGGHGCGTRPGLAGPASPGRGRVWPREAALRALGWLAVGGGRSAPPGLRGCLRSATSPRVWAWPRQLPLARPVGPPRAQSKVMVSWVPGSHLPLCPFPVLTSNRFLSGRSGGETEARSGCAGAPGSL